MPPPQPPRSQRRAHCSDLDQLHHQTCLCTHVLVSFVTNLRGVTVTGPPVSTRRDRPLGPTKLLPPRDAGKPRMKAHLPGSGSHLLLAEPAPGTSTARPHRTGVPDCPPRGQAERCSGVDPRGLHGDLSTSRGRSRPGKNGFSPSGPGLSLLSALYPGPLLLQFTFPPRPWIYVTE